MPTPRELVNSAPDFEFAALSAGVVHSKTRAKAVQEITLTLTAVRVHVADADGYGGAVIATLPDKNLMVIGSETNLVLTKDGTGYLTTVDLDASLGTAVATNATLASTMLNIQPKVDLDADTLAVTMQAHSLASTIVLTPVLDGATNKIYLNVAGATDGSNAAYVDATGTVTLFVIDLGNITS